MSIPYVNLKQISKLDELMVRHFKIPVVMMMENAGYRMAEFIRNKFPEKNNVLICVGKGNNGGDGVAAARHLRNFGYEPKLFLITRNLKKEPRMHFNIANKLKIQVFTSLDKLKIELKETDVVYDCLIGYNLKGEPRDNFSKAIELINESKKKVVACDIPSGVDIDKGIIYKTYIKASHILFLSLPKVGCKNIIAKKYVADIGVPKELYPMINVKAENYFEIDSIIRI